MLITLVLALALITIALLTVLPEIGQQIRRDREEEMTHRGTAYMRAIQHFYKKFGRYPSRIEDLENTNNLRFLRKRYTDPINRDPATGKERDFKFLHQTDISLNNGMVLGQTPGQNLMPGLGGAQGQGAFGGTQGGSGGFGAQAGALQPTGNSGAQSAASGSADDTSSGDSSSSNSDAQGNSSSSGSPSPNSNTPSNSGSGFNGPTFGGGPILGVASTSKAKSIRVFYTKSHYKDWLFIYVPGMERGGLLNGPINPGVQTGISGIGGGIPGQTGGLAVQGQGFGLNAGQSQSGAAQAPQNPSPTSPPN